MTPAPSTRTRVRREPKRGAYDRATIDAILDAGMVAHLGIAVEGQAYVIPTLHARVGDQVYVHGASSSRLLRALTGGAQACLTVTHTDGLVLARSVFNHSINYRSVVLLGVARDVEGAEERLVALRAFTDALLPGRWEEARQPSRKEIKATRVLAFTIDEASAKVRSGGPEDEDEDYALDHWAGVVPLRTVRDEAQPDARLREGIALPPSVSAWTPAS